MREWLAIRRASIADYFVLHLLKTGGATRDDLLANIGVSSSAMKNATHWLVSRGDVEVVYRLTPKGHAKLRDTLRRKRKTRSYTEEYLSSSLAPKPDPCVSGLRLLGASQQASRSP